MPRAVWRPTCIFAARLLFRVRSNAVAAAVSLLLPTVASAVLICCALGLSYESMRPVFIAGCCTGGILPLKNVPQNIGGTNSRDVRCAVTYRKPQVTLIGSIGP